MNETSMTPRGSAFAQPSPLPKPEKPAEEAAQAASQEFATHGDPSLRTQAKGEQTEPGDGRVRVRWERPVDLAMRSAAAGLGKGADWHLAAHDRIRALRSQAQQAASAQMRRLPAAVMGRRQAGPESPGSTPISR